MTKTRFIKRTAGLIAVLALASCFGESTGPEPVRSGRFSVAPVFDVRAIALVSFDSVRLHLTHLDGSAALDTTLFFPANVDTLTLDLKVPVTALTQQFLLSLSMIDSTGATVFTAGPDTVTASAGSPAPPVHPPLKYVGPGSHAAGVRFKGTTPSSAFFQDTVTFQAEAFDSQGVTLANTPIYWSSSDTAKAHVLNKGSGVVVAGVQRGTATITAALLTSPPPVTHNLAVQPKASAITVQSGDAQSAAAGTAETQQVVARVKAQDGLGVQGIPVTFTPGMGAVSKTVDTTDANGDARTTWTLGPTLGAQVLTAQAANVSASVLFGANAIAGAAKKLAFSVPPSNVNPGSSITPAVQVTAQDTFGNTATSFSGATAPVTIALAANPGGATLSGTLTVNAVNGVATFNNLSLNVADTGYTLKATSGTLTSTTSGIFAVNSTLPASLVITSQPVSTTAQTTMAAITVTVKDGQGNTVTSDTNNITAAILTNPSGGTLSGTLTVKPVAGVATFNSLQVDKAGTGYTLQFTRTGPPSIPAVVSNSFNINTGPAAALKFSVQPPASATFQSPFTVAVQAVDAGGNPVSTFSGGVSITIGTNPASGTLFGTTSLAASAGVATFTTLNLDNIGAGYTLSASAGGLAGASSNGFNVVAPAGVNAWINTAGGNWGTASNWSKGTVPSASDTVAIAQSGNYTVNLDVSASPVALGVGAPLGNQVLSVAANVLTLATSNVFTTHGKLSLSGGSLAGTGALTLLNGMDWSGGNLTFLGGISVTGPLNISGSGTSVWNNAAIVASGATVWTGNGTYNTGNGASLSIASGGTLDLQGNPLVQFNQGGTATSLGILSGATMTRSTSVGGATLNVVLNNAGTLSVTSGTLTLSNGGASTGALNVTSGSTLIFNGGTHTLAGSVSDAGQVLVSLGTVSASGWSGAGSVKVQGGTLNANGASMSVDTLVLSAGAIGGGAGGLMTANKVFNWIGGNVVGTGGTIQVASVAAGTLNPSGSVTFTNMTLDLIGSTVWTGTGTINSGLGAQILVETGSTLDIQNAVIIQTNQGGTNTHIHNLGLITRSTVSGLAQIGAEVDNDGQITATAGILRLGNGSGAGTADGVYTSTSPATIEFFQGTHNLGAAGTVNGNGTILIDGGTVNDAGTMAQTGPTQVTGGTFNFNGQLSTIQSLTLTSPGVVGGTNTLTVLGAFTWTGGSLQGAGGTLHMNASATTTINVTGSATWTNEILEIAGPATWLGTGAINSGQGALLHVQNGGTLTIQGDPTFATNQGGINTRLLIDNGGLVTRNTSTNVAVMGVQTDNNGQVTATSGTLRFANGTSSRSDGIYTATSPGIVEFGGGTHTLSSLGTLNGSGSFLVSSGVVNDTGTVGLTTLNVSGGAFNYFGASGNVPTLNLSGGSVGGSGLITVNTAFNWSGSGNVQGTGGTIHMNNTATTTINPTSSAVLTNEVVELAGPGTWAGTGAINTGLAAVLRVLSGGSLNITGDPSFQTNQGGTNTQLQVLSGGTLTRTTSTNPAIMNVETDNDGQIAVTSGTLRLTNGSGAGQSDGVYTTTSPGTLEFGGGTHTLSNLGSVAGSGIALMSSGTVNAAGGWGISGTTQFTGGTLNYNGAGTGTTNAFTLTTGTMGGTGLFTVSGAGTWSGGNIAGGNGTLRVLNPSGTLAINGAGSGVFTAHVLEIGGTSNWSTAFTINTGLGAILRTLSTGTLTISGNGTLQQNQGGATTVVDNQGTLTRTTSAGVATFSAITYQDTIGNTNVATGTLLINGGGRFATGAGRSVGTGASLVMNGGTYGFKQATSFTGAGRVADSSGSTFTPDSNTATAPTTNALSFTNFDLASGTLTHEGLIQVSGTMNWSGGNITSNNNGQGGTTRILASGNLNITGASSRLFTGTHLLEMLGTNNTWTAGPSMFINTGLGAIMRVQTGATLNVTANNPSISLNQGGTATLDNLGTIIRNVGTAGFVINVPVTGTGGWSQSSPSNFDFQCGGGANTCSIGGGISVNGGSVALVNAGIVTLTSTSNTSGSGTIQVNAGTLNTQGPVSIGALNITGGALNMGGQRIVVSGNVTTSGTGVINMTTATNTDSLDIVGNATFGGGLGTMNAGVIRLSGNFTQTGAANFKGLAQSATVAHRVRLNGSNTTVSFADPVNSFFRRMLVSMNAGTALTLNTDVKTTFVSLGAGTYSVKGIASPMSHLTADTIAGGASSSTGFVTPLVLVANVANINDSSNINVDTLVYAGPGQSILTGPFSGGGAGTYTLNNIRVMDSLASFIGPFTFPKDLVIGGVASTGVVTATASSLLTIVGNLRTEGNGVLKMISGGSVTVNGNATFAGGSETGRLTAGTLTVGGNFTQSTNATAFVASGTHSTTFNGSGTQSISFANPTTSFFSGVFISKTGAARFLTDALINNGLSLPGGGIQDSLRGPTAHIKVAGGILSMTQSTTSPVLDSISSVELVAAPSITGGLFAPDTTIYSATLTLPQQNASIAYQSIRISGNVTLAASSTLVATKDFIVDGPAATITIGGQTDSILGNLTTRNGGAFNMTGGTFAVGGNATFSGGTSALSGGTLRLHGNFSEGGGTTSAFQATASHVTEFNNTARRTVTLTDFGTGPTNSRFGMMKLAHAGGAVSLALQTSVQAAMVVDTSAGFADSLIGSTTGIGVTADSTGSLSLQNTVFNNVTLTLSNGGATDSINTMKFINMDPTATFLTMFRNVSAIVNVRGMNFASAHTTGHYFAANTVGAGGPGTFGFLVGSLPASFTAAAGDYTRTGSTLPNVSWNNVTNP